MKYDYQVRALRRRGDAQSPDSMMQHAFFAAADTIEELQRENERLWDSFHEQDDWNDKFLAQARKGQP